MLFDKERVLHVACRMVFREVHRREYVPVILYFRAVSHGEPQASEYVNDFLLDERERVAAPQLDGIRCTCQVQRTGVFVMATHVLAQAVDLFLRSVFQLVEFHADFALVAGRHGTEVRHEVIDYSFFAQVFDAECFYLFFVVSAQRFDFVEQRFDFLYHVFFCLYSRNSLQR